MRRAFHPRSGKLGSTLPFAPSAEAVRCHVTYESPYELICTHTLYSKTFRALRCFATSDGKEILFRELATQG